MRGFQGVSCKGEITTLGRGGSDVSAVALGAALQADKVEFYKDVEGVYAEDPKKNPQAKLFRFLTYKQALALHDHVLHPRSILLASKKQLPLHVLPFKTYLFDTDFEKIRSHLYFKKDESAGFLKDQEGEIVPGFENVIGSLIGESIKSVEGFKEEKKRAKVH